MKAKDNTEMSARELIGCVGIASKTKKLRIKQLIKIIEKGDANTHIKKVNALMNDIYKCSEDINNFKKELEERGADNE